MSESGILKRLESYSNAILAFVVVQGIGFCYQLSTSTDFKNIVQSHRSLSIIMLIMFSGVLMASLYANHKISAAMQKRSDGNDKVLTVPPQIPGRKSVDEVSS
jgi:hypothetical protein